MTSEKASKSWKWTKEAVLADALKYSSKSEWRKNSRAYAIATRQGWLDEACTHMQVLWTAKWNKDAVLADALKYQARGEWENNSSGAVASAKRNGWYEEATTHMPMLIERWTKESVIADAQKYQTRSEWFANSKSYHIARNNGWVQEATAHMFNTLSFGELVIYTFLLEHDIAFTHQKTFEDLRDINKLPYDFYLNEYNLLVEYNGVQHERGWQGDAEDAENIKRRDKIKRDYALANNLNYLMIDNANRDDIVSELVRALLLIKPSVQLVRRLLTKEETKLLRNIGVYTKEDVLASSALYATIRDWRKNEDGAYNKALKMGWIEDATSHMTRLINRSGHWTKERVIASAKPFSTQTAWKKEHGGAWSKAVSMGWTQEACAHMEFNDESKVKPQGYWTKERVIASAKPHPTQAEWRANEPSAVGVAKKKGWFDEATGHMSASRPNQKANGFWTKERVLEDAKKYSSKTEWLKYSKGAASKAYRMGWMEEAQVVIKLASERGQLANHIELISKS